MNPKMKVLLDHWPVNHDAARQAEVENVHQRARWVA
jgi:hypothetical protein